MAGAKRDGGGPGRARACMAGGGWRPGQASLRRGAAEVERLLDVLFQIHFVIRYLFFSAQFRTVKSFKGPFECVFKGWLLRGLLEMLL